MKRLLMLALCLCLFVLSAQAEETTAFPNGKALEWEAVLLGRQFRADEGNTEDVYMLNLYLDGDFFQQLYFTTQETREEGPFIKAADLNFDGYPDLDIVYQLGASNSRHIFFFYDQETGKYEPWIFTYMGLSNYDLDAEHAYIINYDHNSALSGVKTIYRWDGKTLQPVRSAGVYQDEYDEYTFRLTVSYYSYGPARKETKEYQRLNIAEASDEEALEMWKTLEELMWDGLQ